MHFVVKHTLALCGLYALVVTGLALLINLEMAAPMQGPLGATPPGQDTPGAYEHVHGILLLTALCGLMAIAALGALLHARLRRTGANLTTPADPATPVDAAAQPDSQPSPNLDDELAGERSPTYRLGNELHEDLLAATRARGLAELYAAAAHDLRAPLNAVSLHLEMLKRSLAVDDASAPARRLHYTGALRKEFTRLKDLLQSLLELCAPPQAEPGVMSLNGVIERLAVLVSAQARRQRAALGFDLPSTPAHVYGSAGDLQQALLNVILNALEHTAPDGRVDVRLRVDPPTALVSICDNGPGIAPGLQPRIFDLHFTTKKGRAGIGLYVARLVIEAHGGQLRVESDAGLGACFYVSLPLHSDNAPA